MIINQNKTISLSEAPNFVETTLKEEFQSFEWSESYEYRPNPRIESFDRKNTIKSGNTNITVNGFHLNSVSKPRILVTAYSPITQQQIQMESHCFVNSGGSQMICPTPAIRDPIPPPLIKVPIETQLSFVLDGVRDYWSDNRTHKPRLIYFPDPSYLSFEEEARVVYLEEPVLRIDGEDLSSEYPIDIRIDDVIPCNLSESNTFKAIYCRIQYNDSIFKLDGQKHSVRIRVGKITFKLVFKNILIFMLIEIIFPSKPREYGV